MFSGWATWYSSYLRCENRNTQTMNHFQKNIWCLTYDLKFAQTISWPGTIYATFEAENILLWFVAVGVEAWIYSGNNPNHSYGRAATVPLKTAIFFHVNFCFAFCTLYLLEKTTSASVVQIFQ